MAYFGYFNDKLAVLWYLSFIGRLEVECMIMNDHDDKMKNNDMMTDYFEMNQKYLGRNTYAEILRSKIELS